MTIKRLFVPIRGAQLMVRRVGEGPPVILMHPSPQSSAFSIPMANKLAAAGFTAIAVDTPGYGLSDPLVGGYPQGLDRDHGLDPFLPPLVQMLDSLGLAKAAFYGNATGAEIGHIFAHNHPDRCAAIMIDTAGHNSDEAVDKITAGYFPDVTPRRDGGHLLTYWDMCRFLAIYAPWQFTDHGHRLNVDAPDPERTQRTMLEYMRAGPDYPTAYRPAFYTAKNHLISRIKVPATLTRWDGKPDLREVDDLIAYGLPANFTVLRPGLSMDQRFDASVDYLVKNYLKAGTKAPIHPKQVDDGAARLQKMFIDVPGGQLFARVSLSGRGRPILGLHDPAGSSRRLEPILAPYAGHRPVVALDHPSSGESDKLLTREQISTEAYASAAWAALDALGIKEVDIIGRYSGGQVALEMSRQRPGAVKHIVHAGVQIFTDAERADLLANYTPSIAPKWDGSHLITAWGMMRDMALFWPWYNRTRSGIVRRDAAIDGATIHGRVEDLLKIGDAYRNADAASFTYPMAERLGESKTPNLMVDLPGAASYARVAMAKAAAPNVGTADLPDDVRGWRAVFDTYFAS
jgi:pimeloyl-ACP methyl ester carboxylesterase